MADAVALCKLVPTLGALGNPFLSALQFDYSYEMLLRARKEEESHRNGRLVIATNDGEVKKKVGFEVGGFRGLHWKSGQMITINFRRSSRHVNECESLCTFGGKFRHMEMCYLMPAAKDTVTYPQGIRGGQML